ncbi:MAG TPA: PfkB family carbohydrate kinase [Candidatus Limnocylindrales bacterium]|nr:PfkB family carbohydrate kinase [Candidatus Limnocylindrales bacterium]
MRPEVACVGHPFLDLIFRGLAAIPAPGEEQVARELAIVPGAIANVAYALRRLGLDAVICAPIGSDPAGRLLKQLLDEAGVPWIGRASTSTPVSVALPAAGDRAFVTAAPPPEIDTETLASLEPRAVVADLPNVALLPSLATHPRVYAVLGDPEVQALAGRLPASLDHVCALILNEREARALTGLAERDAAARRLAGLGTTVVMTCGPDGAVAAQPDGTVARASAIEVEADDTTGAGDLFTAAWVRADLAGQPLDERLAFATRYASMSLAATPAGRQKGLTLEEVMQEV